MTKLQQLRYSEHYDIDLGKLLWTFNNQLDYDYQFSASRRVKFASHASWTIKWLSVLKSRLCHHNVWNMVPNDGRAPRRNHRIFLDQRSHLRLMSWKVESEPISLWIQVSVSLQLGGSLRWNKMFILQIGLISKLTKMISTTNGKC